MVPPYAPRNPPPFLPLSSSALPPRVRRGWRFGPRWRAVWGGAFGRPSPKAARAVQRRSAVRPFGGAASHHPCLFCQVFSSITFMLSSGCCRRAELPAPPPASAALPALVGSAPCLEALGRLLHLSPRTRAPHPHPITPNAGPSPFHRSHRSLASRVDVWFAYNSKHCPLLRVTASFVHGLAKEGEAQGRDVGRVSARAAALNVNRYRQQTRAGPFPLQLRWAPSVDR